MKKKALLSSILTIVLCLSLIAGSTFALFTSQSQVNIAVTAGKIEVEANISGLTLYSVKANPVSGTVTDEYGYKYDYEKQHLAFINGGTATLVGNELTLDKLTPGDKVTFTIEIANTSDVAAQYRTLVYSTSNDGLLKGLEIGLDGDTFNGFAYTEWTSLAAGADIEDVAVTVELPVTAGNEYQETSASLCFIVEAVQSNGAIAYDYLPDVDADGAYEIANAADLFIFASKVNDKSFVDAKAELTADIDLAGKVWMPIDGKSIVFDGQGHTISNLYAFEKGAADGKDAAGLFGKTTSCTISNVNIDKATVISNHWAAGIAAYALCTKIDNCTVTNSTITTSAQKLGNAWDNGDKAGAIAGYLSAQPAASVTNCTVENVTVKGYRDIGGVVGYADAKAVVTGNTISDSTIICDPTHNYKNYTATDDFDINTIVGDGAVDASNTATNVKVDVPVFSADDLVKALENGENVLFENDVKIEPANMSNSYGTTGINVKNGQTIDGNGNTLDIKGAGGTWDSGINTTGGLIKNLTVTGSFRGIFINHNSTHSEKVILENVIIDGTVYTISCDQGLNQGFEAKSSTFNGWTSYAATLGYAKFVDCSFGEGRGYAYCRPYAPTEFVGCDFAAGYVIDPRADVTFENCTFGGVELTEENIANLVTNVNKATVK